MALYFNGNKIIGSDGTCSADKVSLDDTNLAYEADDVQEALEKVTKSLTWADYNALTTEEKNNGTIYLITDVNGDGQDFQPVIYSENEKEIGVWVDGKPLYEKTINVGAISSDTSVAHGITNLDTIIDYSGFGVYGSSDKAVMPFQNPSNGTGFGLNYYDATNLYLKKSSGLGSNFSGCYITIRYTKSTDQAGSGTWTPQGVPAVHYSTDEHIVGTWTDGSPLYEKTYSVSSLSSSSALIDSSITSETAKIRSTSYGSYRLSGAGYDAQYVSHTSYSIFARLVFNPNGLYANIENITSGVTASDFDITIRYTKSST